MRNERLANVSEWQLAGDLGFGTAVATPRSQAGLSRAPVTAKLGYRVHRSRRRKGRDNAGQFRSLTVLLGTGFTATLESIREFMDRDRVQ
jgi:hypothetical protein